MVQNVGERFVNYKNVELTPANTKIKIVGKERSQFSMGMTKTCVRYPNRYIKSFEDDWTQKARP